MSIPKVIHYCWFGGNILPEKVQKCIKSWKKYCPDYEIIRWSEENYDVHKIRYMSEAHQHGKWAFVSDYARLDIVYQHGGIYLDTDVELVKPLDDLLQEDIFLAIEKHNCTINTGLGFGALKGSAILNYLMDLYKPLSFVRADGKLNLTVCPQYATSFFLEKGFVMEDRTQRIGRALILSSDFFCPMNYSTGEVDVTGDTVGIHWFEASWFGEGDKHIHKIEMKIRRRFSGKAGMILCFIYRKSYRLLEYSRKGILLGKIKEKMWD